MILCRASTVSLTEAIWSRRRVLSNRWETSAVRLGCVVVVCRPSSTYYHPPTYTTNSSEPLSPKVRLIGRGVMISVDQSDRLAYYFVVQLWGGLGPRDYHH